MGIFRFYYGPMSSGKSTLALQTAFNLEQAGKPYVLFTLLDRSGENKITSRIGISRDALLIDRDTNLFNLIQSELKDRNTTLLFDEAQFLRTQQVDDIAMLVDDESLNISAFMYGLLTDFKSRLFPGSQRCLELADEICALQSRALCWCGEVTTHNARTDQGYFVGHGEQILVGDVGSDSVGYEPLCRKHWMRQQTKRNGLVSR